jgi:hypothetical protein
VDGSYFGSAPEAVLDGEAGLAGDEAPDGAAEDDAADTAGAAELPPLEPQAPTPAASATPKIIGIQILRMESAPRVQRAAVHLQEGGSRCTPYGLMVGLGSAKNKTPP